MLRLVGVALLGLAVGGCTSVKMVQREGCWVRRTEKPFGRVVEEVGPCARAKPQWAQDRLTRLVQECLADADYKWQARELEVWSRRLPYPTPQPRQDEILRECMDQARTALSSETDVAVLRSRIAELSGERDGLKADVDRDRAKLHESHQQIAEWLGKAAQKPPGSATASATSTSASDGKATTESGTTLDAQSASSPPMTAGSTPVTSPAARKAETARSGYILKPTPRRSKPVPSSTRRSTECNR